MVKNKGSYEAKLYYSCRDEESSSWKEIAPVPPKIMFELTNECNHRCIFCANRAMKRSPGFLDFDIYKTIAEEAVRAGVKEIALYTTGESLLHPNIVAFVEYAKRIGFSYIYLSSNGVLLTPEMSEALLRAGLNSLRLSINAGSRESYLKVHGADDFELVLRNLKAYDRIRKQLGAEKQFLSVSCVLTNLTISEKEQLESLVGPNVDALKWTYVRVQGGKMPGIIKKLSPKMSDERYRLKPCGLLWNGMHVDNKGQLSICCVDFESEMTVGNILERGLLECWNGSEMREYRRMHLAHSLPRDSLCYKCLTGEIV
ncbi:MAG: radical SAM protein [Deltaproteobacteria bacterium]|nr:radical SAM protein [Deltaproteobacteria bacterium]